MSDTTKAAPKEVCNDEGLECPHCGHVEHDDLHDVTEQGNEWFCNSCGEEFSASRNVSVSYTTSAVIKVPHV